MSGFRFHLVIASVAMLAALACGKKQEAATGGKPAPAATHRAAEEKPAAFAYPPPVKGHLSEVNTGDFDLVDGVAYPAKGGDGTVVFVVSKPIASPVLADSPCPMTQARALTALRNAGYVELTLDKAGWSDYFARGTPFGGTGREQNTGGRYWSSKLALANGRATGSVQHKNHGGFEFDLPVSSPKLTEVSENDRSQQRYGDPLGVTPTEEQVTAAYQAVRGAALEKDLKALLAAQGFDEKQIAAIRGLEGIDADFAAYTDRFLEPGTTGEFQNGPGWGAIVGTGANSKGAKFLNFYWFTPCREKLVLVAISENPQ
jgi:hypothetical protein